MSHSNLHNKQSSLNKLQQQNIANITKNFVILDYHNPVKDIHTVIIQHNNNDEQIQNNINNNTLLNQEYQQNHKNYNSKQDTCMQFNKGHFDHFLHYIKHNSQIQHQIQTTITLQKHLDCKQYEPIHHDNFFRDWRYGNWCGVDYGGFDGPCMDKCLENQWHPSEDCVKCCEPMDYLDKQCMFHDFCQERFEKYHEGSDACKHSATMGGEFPTPCNCSIHLMGGLQFEKLVENCDSATCIMNGMALREAVDNIIMDCGCTFKDCTINDCQEKQICTDPQTCLEFGGV